MKSTVDTLTPRLALEFAAFAAVIVADAFGVVPLTLTIGLLPVIWALLLLAREPWSSIGLSLPVHMPRAVAIGVAAGVAMELLAVFVTTPGSVLSLESSRVTRISELFRAISRTC